MVLVESESSVGLRLGAAVLGCASDGNSAEHPGVPNYDERLDQIGPPIVLPVNHDILFLISCPILNVSCLRFCGVSVVVMVVHANGLSAPGHSGTQDMPGKSRSGQMPKDLALCPEEGERRIHGG
jgi:hypothetical protein